MPWEGVVLPTKEVEAKASRSTPLTTPQEAGKELTAKGSMNVRSNNQSSIYSSNNVVYSIGSTTVNKNIKHQSFYKIYSKNGFGNEIEFLDQLR